MKKYQKIIGGILMALNSVFTFGNPQEKTPIDNVINIQFNYENKFKDLENPDYSYSFNRFNINNFNLIRGSVTPGEEIIPVESGRIETPLKNAMEKKIDSTEFINELSNLSENEQLVFLSGLGDTISYFGYDIDLAHKPLGTYKDFFNSLVNKLKIGVCKQIASNVERTASKLGIPAATVSGLSGNRIGHAYNVVKTKDGSAVINYYELLQTNTKNIERLLKLYEEKQGTMNLAHSFYKTEKSPTTTGDVEKFRYRLITEQGKAYLDFLDYDTTTNSLKEKLEGKEEKSMVSEKLGMNSDIAYSKLNFNGANFKIGELEEKSLILKNKLILVAAGYEKAHDFLGLEIKPKIDLISARLEQNLRERENSFPDIFIDNYYGLDLELMVSTHNSEGLNLGARFVHTSIFGWPIDYNVLFSDLTFGGGASYKIIAGNNSITPYLAGQFTSVPNNLAEEKYLPKFSELNTGMKLEATIGKDFNFSIDPSYTWRIWEQGFGISANVDTKHFGVSLDASATDSLYEFCPDKLGLRGKAYFNINNFLTITGNIGMKRENSDGEIDDKYFIGVSGSVKF